MSEELKTEELKPCPFCGGEATVRKKNSRWRVECRKCSMRSVKWYYSESKAITAWNTRDIARMRIKAVETGVSVKEQKAGQMGLFE